MEHREDRTKQGATDVSPWGECRWCSAEEGPIKDHACEGVVFYALCDTFGMNVSVIGGRR